jgi:hypothetical protein
MKSSEERGKGGDCCRFFFIFLEIHIYFELIFF